MTTQQLSTQTIHIGVGKDSATGAISYPIYPSATYRHPAVGQSTGFDYTRSGNPTRNTLEAGLANLEGGARALTFASGMAALTTLFLHFKSGDHVIASQDIYGGTYRLLSMVLNNLGISATYVDTTDASAVSAAITPATRALLVETPGNPLMGISDLEALGKICQQHQILFLVDNTFMTPLLQKPFAFGADVVIHSGTKYLGGHNDLCSGVLVARTAEMGERLYFLQNSTGAILPPQDSWLLLRSLKTLHLRMERHCHNALQVAQWLQQHPNVQTVYYPGLASHPGHTLARRQASDFGGMLSFRVKDKNIAHNTLARLQLISFAESLGGVESLMTLPAIQTHGDIPEPERLRLGIDECLLRLSVGVEDVRDIIADLKQALNQ
ncbi:Cys/Met metabolism pyridoxal-phosphate-dependent protein [Desulfurispirillum indicum S5]|uniref:Cys/Met metabolism pyridoxal-phosphate-dependent protein n=1 Tax=Desulfurispirillum indicum (strain ATCC BAA-1389 / DSM 22839 / S5) TaxID=653733 RepID=E6W3A4_DESIS|nr:PLP-dependent aspartate aminotransferase family protein [Desulfurispirillum indicum]ADU66858.1 Cys/Met metabolism pyridoxal-phosphate-dependent protein [Desulfurispirillum indicum S5]